MRHFLAAPLCALVIALCSPHARADRAAIEATLKKMEAAVLAGDPAAYLAHVATGDAVFLQEQKMWAKDLLTHKPVAFSLSIIEDEPPAKEVAPGEAKEQAEPGTKADEPSRPTGFKTEFGTDTAKVMLRMAWTLTDESKERAVRYPVSFTRKDSAWHYEGEIWNTLDRPATETDAPNRVLFADGLDKTAKTVADVLVPVRTQVDGVFGIKNTDLLTVKLYTSMGHLQASIYLSYVNGLSGWNEPDESIKILSSRNSGAAGLKSLLSHEYGHCDSFKLGPKINDAPWWVLEGIAEFSSSSWRKEPAASATRRVIAWAAKDSLAKWEDLADFRTVPLKLHSYVYTQSEHMMHYFTQTYGDAKRNAWLTEMATGKTIDQATLSVTGVSFADLDRAWREHVKELADKKAAEEKAKEEKAKEEE